MKNWECLFTRAVQVVDAAQRVGSPRFAWSLGGGSVLMRRLRHRHSTGVDISLRDARLLHCISPRLNGAVRALSGDYVQDSTAVRIFFPEGQVAFIAGGPLAWHPLTRESILGRSVLVEASAEILARKLWHRGASLPARDLFDFAAVAALEPDAIHGIGIALRVHRAVLLERLREHGEALREDFAALHAWDFNPTYEECTATLRAALFRSLLPPVVEQQRRPYTVHSFHGSEALFEKLLAA
jgi:hypothetical protein